jgi:hypothetical protein
LLYSYIFERIHDVSWVTIVAIVSAIIGLISGANGLRSLRASVPTQADFTWKQAPLSPWRYETPTIIAITLHTISLVCLTAFVLLSVARSNLFNTFSLAIPSLLLSVLALFAVFFTPYACSVAVAYHFTQPWISPIMYGLREDGMLYGSTLIPWKSFSHYEVGPDDGLISLFSSYSPTLRTWAIRPPGELFTGVLALIQKNLPSMPPAEDSIPWYRSPLALILETTLLVFLPLLLIIWGWIQIPSGVWIYALIAFFFVQYFGIQLFTIFDGRGQTSMTEIARQ